MKNYISEIRADSRFDNYKPKTSSQMAAHEFMVNLAGMVIKAEDTILQKTHPFPESNLVFLHGRSGTGKTHLKEAFINQIQKNAPALTKAGKLWLFRGNFGDTFMGTPSMEDKNFDPNPIILIDDMFSQRASIDNLYSTFDTQALLNFTTKTYEKKNLVIVSSNFGPEVLSDFAAKHEKTGRLKSRLSEAYSYYIEGPDHRVEKPKNAFKLF